MSKRPGRCRAAITGFKRRSWNERATILYALGIGLVVELGLRTMALPRLCRLLGITLLESRGVSPRGDTTGTRRTAPLPTGERDIEAVLRNWPWGDTCLRRALVIGCLRRHERPCLCIGVGRDGDEVIAHAWLEVDDEPIGPAASPELVRLTARGRRPGPALR